jgi:putative SOS response-associated peptidase YedK
VPSRVATPHDFSLDHTQQSERAVQGGKQLYFISAAEGAALSIAGLWDEWKDPLGVKRLSVAR